MSKITHQMIRDYLSTFAWFRDPSKQDYLRVSLDRFAYTLNLIPRLPNPEQVKVLEIGGVPYFMTVLIKKFFGYDVQVANEPTWERGAENNHEVLTNDAGETFDIRYKTLNIEYDRWPFDDGSFDIVLYCEVIEHLVYDPTHTLVEAHRVLKKDSGKLLISTPNALNWIDLVKMIRGKNFFPPYVGYNHYARHHRLFSTDELRHLVGKVGYQVHYSYSVYDRGYLHPKLLNRLIRPLIRLGLMKKRLDVIYLLATPTGKAKHVYPDQPPYVLYEDVHGYRKVASNEIVMSNAENTQLVDGFHELESGSGVRWTSGKARLFLRHDDEQQLSITFHSGPATRGATVTGRILLSDHLQQGETSHDFSVPTASWQTLTFPLPDDAPDELLVTIEVHNVLIPARVDRSSRDERELGVAVREVKLV